jgi:large subunit ribosomal protein L25
MAEQVELVVAHREVMGKKTKHLRKAGIIPANVFGHKEEPVAIQIEAIEFERLRRSHGTRNIIALRLPDLGVQTALIRHVQHDPVSRKILHIDFIRMSMTERTNVRVPLRFVGEAPGVKVEGGVLLHLLEALEVECLASDIPDALEVDITPLAQIDDMLHAKDVKLPEGFTLLTDPEEPVAKIEETRAEVAEEAESAAAAASEPEGNVAAPETGA